MAFIFAKYDLPKYDTRNFFQGKELVELSNF